MISADVVRAIIAGMKLPRLEVYSGDWLKDPVSACSIAAQGLWFRMLLAMHDSKPYGHLCDAHGQPLQDIAIVRRCGTSGVREMKRLLQELTDVGTPGLSGDKSYTSSAFQSAEFNGEAVDLTPLFVFTEGVLYSRRLLRDQRLRVLRKMAGNPDLLRVLTPAKFGDLPTQTREVSPHVRVGARADNDIDLGSDSHSQVTKNTEGVQGEPSRDPYGGPDFGAVERVNSKIDQSALATKPSLQIVTAWLSEFDEGLILETLIDCEPSYAGKGYQYLERILTTRRNDPSQRPGQRRAKGNGNGRNGSNGNESRPTRKLSDETGIPDYDDLPASAFTDEGGGAALLKPQR